MAQDVKVAEDSYLMVLDANVARAQALGSQAGRDSGSDSTGDSETSARLATPATTKGPPTRQKTGPAVFSGQGRFQAVKSGQPLGVHGMNALVRAT